MPVAQRRRTRRRPADDARPPASEVRDGGGEEAAPGPSIEVVPADVSAEVDREGADRLPAGAVIRAQGLRKVYRGRAVVKDVSIQVHQGEVVGLLGPNGAGKTTTFYMVVGLTRPDRGRIFLDDEEISDLPMYLRAQRGLSYLPQEPSVFRKMSVENNLRAVFETQSLTSAEMRRRIDQLIHELDLERVRKSFGHELSGGERRRVEIARALAIDPRFVLLDEPFAGIDPKAVLGIQQIVRHLRNMGIGILITDHNVRETLSITDRAYIINNGEILRAGSPEVLSSDPQVRKIYLGDGFRL
ncbi:MAG: LPS export ABC transporter ATP-binding protein [Acidobacteria bacterium]|nr:MAG: LPS export ABC transporter ATP-binding protein [Acidobacteriota bacterium]REK10384.1 MAG: LPS export ABC transporter ATP-binding protein [Acidobacteriota bacterium]